MGYPARGSGDSYIGLYSAKAAEKFGSGFYETPGGGEVEVTTVGPRDTVKATYKYDDAVDVGPVTCKFLRRGKSPSSDLKWL